MKKTITLLLFSLLTLSADIDMPKEDLNIEEVRNIKSFYKKYLQKSCRYTAANFAQMHTQDEWKTMKKKQIFIE